MTQGRKERMNRHEKRQMFAWLGRKVAQVSGKSASRGPYPCGCDATLLLFFLGEPPLLYIPHF